MGVWNKIRSGYGKAVAWVDEYPQVTLWLASVALAGALVIGAVL